MPIEKIKLVFLFLCITIFNQTFAQKLLPQKTVLICGAGGFIGHHLVTQYKKEGYWVRGVDIKYPSFENTKADEFLILDLRTAENAEKAVALPNSKTFDEACQLAANMGGVGFIFSHSSEIMRDSAQININVLEASRKANINKIFFSSSACAYPQQNQNHPTNYNCPEYSIYPAHPDTDYGWEKIFSERLYTSYAEEYGMNICIARFHSIFGPLGEWQGGREKSPSALCRKIALAKDGDTIEVWGDGNQTRSFLYIDECIEGIRRMMVSEKKLPVLNIGSDQPISINDLAKLIAKMANKKINIKNVPGPVGVKKRNSNNTLIQQQLGWKPSEYLEIGLQKLYAWIEEQIAIEGIK